MHYVQHNENIQSEWFIIAKDVLTNEFIINIIHSVVTPWCAECAGILGVIFMFF